MSAWTHPVCPYCYDDLYPGREPVVVEPRTSETCCFCGIPTRSGIYVRADPSTPRFCEGHKDD